MTSAPAADYQVIVIGGGPTGVTAATLLGQQGVRCLLLDRYEDVYPQPRAVHLDDEVYRILGHLGVADAFAEISRPSQGLRLLSPRHKVLAEFSRSGFAPKSGYPRANMFDQPVLEALLRDNLATVPSVSFAKNAEVIDLDTARLDAVPVTYVDKGTNKRHTVTGTYVLGCDGANSVVRSAIKAEYADLNFEQRWLVIDVDTNADLNQWEGVHQVCDSRRAGTYMRVSDTRYRWEFALHPDESTADYDTLTKLLPLISPWTGNVSIHDMALIRVAEYTFRAMVANRWRQGSTFILGDAAHLTPPFIGQGMGAGMRDAHNLAWKIAGVLNGTLQRHVLDSYEPERKTHATAIVKLARLTGIVMTQGGRIGDQARFVIAPMLSTVPGVRGRLISSETSALARNRWISGRRIDRLAGTLAPNGRIAGTRFDDLNRTGLAVLALPNVAREVHSSATQLGCTVIEVTPGHELGRWLRHGRASAAIVRPDSTVLASAKTSRAVIRHLEALGRP